MIISVASGKGGTGKTTVAVNLALSLDRVQFVDCDVEEPNAHLFLKPRMTSEKRASVPVPEVDETLCTHCGTCREVCAYHAIAVLPVSSGNKGNVLMFPHLCHSCGACQLLCPQKAIRETNREIGAIETGEREKLRFIHGRLDIGEAMAPPLIRRVKQSTDPAQTVIVDAPPGTSCPMVAAVRGSDVCVLVTEPTPFGLNDLELAAEVLKKLQIPFGVVINRSDIGDGSVERYCKEESIPVLMQIPFSRELAVCYSEGVPIVEKDESYRKKFSELYSNICRIQRETNPRH